MNTPADPAPHLRPFPAAANTPKSRAIVRGEGVRIYNDQGDEFIDGAAALWCVNVGYGRDEIIDAMAEQGRRLPFFHSFAAFSNEPSERLAERITRIAPHGIEKVFFGLSGSDANDSAAKVIWHYNNLRGRPKKKKFISRRGNYHGTGVVGASLSGIGYMHDQFGLPLPGFLKVSETDTYRLPELHPNASEDEYSEILARELDDLIVAEGADTVAAFVAEPIMTNAGVRVPPTNYFKALRRVLDKHDVLLWMDEVVCGFGRLGHWFGSQYFDVVPDLMTSAKGLTSGYCPMSALLLGENISRTLNRSARQFSHGYTYSAHPVAAAAGNAVLDIIERDCLRDNVTAMGDELRSALRRRVADNPVVGEVRGTGLLCGIELVADRKTKRSLLPDSKAATRAADLCYEEGAVLRGLPLIGRDCLALSPPFTITGSDVESLVERVGRGLDRFAGEMAAEASRVTHALL